MDDYKASNLRPNSQDETNITNLNSTMNRFNKIRTSNKSAIRGSIGSPADIAHMFDHSEKVRKEKLALVDYKDLQGVMTPHQPGEDSIMNPDNQMSKKFGSTTFSFKDTNVNAGKDMNSTGLKWQ